ncbi:hypothetical protein Sme01_07390 [Sphaerisporangium melleum]|uniref:Serine protease n=1 Tax=Sphaerisporangium melleum TaxID=321316 RepID=A0A917VG14_9ACTN|nr:S8 family serine peptidase [Sphaerisporangium melleum]GGK73026.1 hypothetical protein GCM10007964_14810 [Sphaerisporangium melleum]GII68263.1 hypothetical protein Sme01_07390 [Sphaerisporangium melleum]
MPPAHPPSPLPSRTRHITVAVLAAAGLLTTGAVVPFTAAAATSPPASAAPAQGAAGRYIVTLREPAAATYAGDVAGKARTAPRAGEGLKSDSAPVRAYRDYLHQRQKRAAAAVDAKVISSYSAAYNGFTAELGPEQVERLREDPSVVSVVKDDLRKPLAAVTSTDYLGLSGDTGVWAANGGVDKAGEGIVVGVIDTGIAPENPSFAGAPLGTEPGLEPYLDGSAIKYRKADGGTFTGACTTGVQFTAADCTTKLVSARYFADNFGVGHIGGPEAGEYLSPRDGEAHGSHTASTAAGANGIDADIRGVAMGKISGVAPAAKVAAYKACWSGPNAAVPDDDGCATGDLLAAIDAAVADNVDVINYSIGTMGGAQSTDGIIDEAFRNAAASGVFVAAAGGNAGPGAGTVDNAAPWITTVAASTIPAREATVELGDGVNLLGASISVPAGGRVTGPLAAGSAAGSATCGPDTLDAAKVTGKIVLCERGDVDRRAKSTEVKRAGGIGVILVNPEPDSVDLDAHDVPTVHIDADGYEALVAYASTGAPTATLVDGNPHGLPPAPAPQIAGFSSRGPVNADGGDLIKPDVAAPGVAILADGANAAGARPSFTFMSGTSMASPHVAGLAALYLGVHPQASPAEIKSALMTTTSPAVAADGRPSGDVFARGNGQVTPARYLDPGLLYLNGPDDWAGYVAAVHGDPAAPDPSDLNLASIAVGALAGRQTVKRTVTSAGAGTFTADPVQIPGVRATVEPATLTFTEPGQAKSFQVTFTRTTAPLGEYTTGELIWRDGERSVRSALAVRPVALEAPAGVTATGGSGRTTLNVLGGDVQDVPLKVTGLSRGLRVAGSGAAGGPARSHIVQVPAGTAHARFVLDAAGADSDLDLAVYRLNEYGDRSLVAEAATPSAGEQIDLDDPQDGLYLVEVSFFAGTGPLGFTVTSFALQDTGGEGGLTARPSTVSLGIGSATPVTLAWTGLRDGGVYLGRVTYGDTGRATYVTVTSDPRTGPPPTDPGARPVVTVTPEYAVPGRSVIVLATGLTPAVDFGIRLKGAKEILASGRTSDEGGVALLVPLPATVPIGRQTIEVLYAGRTAAGTVTVSPLVLGDIDHDDRYAFDGNPLVRLTAAISGKGRVNLTVKGASDVYLNRTGPADSGTWKWFARSFDPVETMPERLTATVSVVLDNGRTGQSKSVSWTPAAVGPGTASITKDGRAAHTVRVSFTNSSDYAVFPALRYKLTSGELIFANLHAEPGATVTRSSDVTGVDRLDLLLDGATIATYRNPEQSRLAGRPAMGEPFYATFTRGRAGHHGAPLTMTVTNRPAAYTAGFSLSAGVGVEIDSGDFLHYEDIPNPIIPQAGAPISRTFSLPAGRPLWLKVYYDVHAPDIRYEALRRILVTPLTDDDLAPVRGRSAPEFVVDALPREATGGTTVSVTAAGLSAGERFTVRIGGRTAGSGRATEAGFAHVFARVPDGHGRVIPVKVTGDHPNRSGETVLTTP